MRCPVCRPSSLQPQVQLGQRTDYSDRPGLSSVSGFCQYHWRVHACKKAAAAGGSGSDDEAFCSAQRSQPIRWGGRVQRTAETDEMLERPRTQRRWRRGRTLPALIERSIWVGVRPRQYLHQKEDQGWHHITTLLYKLKIGSKNKPELQILYTPVRSSSLFSVF